MLRQKLQRYAIITSIILVILLVATITTYAFQKDQTLTNPQLVEDYSYTLIDNTSFNFSTMEFETINYNSSMTVVDVLSIDSLTTPPNLIMVYGSKENTTGFQHGFIELYAVSQVGYQAALQKVAGFLDASPDNETVFQKGCYFINNIDDLFFYMLKQKGPDYFIDILAYQDQHLELNASIPINSLLLEETWDFAVMDKELDKLVNLFLVGQNQTTHKISLVEFQLNMTTINMNYVQSFSWDFQGRTFVDLQTTIETDDVNFYLCTVGTSPALHTSMTVFSVQKTLGSPLTLLGTNNYTYGSNAFRAYATKFLSGTSNGAYKQLALFGTFIIDGLDSYPYCLIVSYTNGIQTAVEGIQLEQTPSWCLTGFVVDLNDDSEKELVLFTYDFVYHQRSEFTLLSNTTKHELTSGLYSFSQVKSSALLTLEGLSIGAILAKDLSQNDVLVFHKLGFTPFKLRANSELLQINSLNSLLMESYALNGTPITISNSLVNFVVQGVVNLDTTLTILPSIITLEIPSFAHWSDLLQFTIDIFQKSFIIYSKTFYVSLGYVPKITVVAPGSPIAVRFNESKTKTFEFLISNQLPESLTGEISIISSQRTKTTQINCLPSEETEIAVSFNFAKPTGIKRSVENLSILIKTQIGTFIFQYAVVVSTGLTIGYMGLTAILVTSIFLTMIGYLAFVFAISRDTEERLVAYYLSKGPKKLEFKRFEKQAQRHLLQKCLQKKDWQVGLELAKAHYPEYVAKFMKFKADEQLLSAQKLLRNGEFIKGLSHLESAREALETIRSKPFVELLDQIITHLKKLLDAIEHMKGLDKVTMLKDAFQKLLRLRKKKEEEEEKEGEFSLKEFPFYLIAKELGVAFKENGDLENALNFLQIAYQDAPNGKKNDIVLAITDLIRLGLKPRELTIPDDFEAIKERLKNKKIMCFNCGFKYFDSEPTCPQCGMGTVKCSVCKLPISFGSSTLECPHCHTIAHQEHLLEWIKVKGTCPVCQQKLTLAEFSPITQT